MPHEVGRGVGGGGHTMAQRSTRAAKDCRRGPTLDDKGVRGYKHASIGLQSSYHGQIFNRKYLQCHPLPLCAPVQLTGLYYPIPTAIPSVVCCHISLPRNDKQVGPYLEDTHLTEAHQNSPRLFRRHSLETSESAKRGRHISPHMSKMMIIVNAGTLNKSLLNSIIFTIHLRTHPP